MPSRIEAREDAMNETVRDEVHLGVSFRVEAVPRNGGFEGRF